MSENIGTQTLEKMIRESKRAVEDRVKLRKTVMITSKMPVKPVRLWDKQFFGTH